MFFVFLVLRKRLATPNILLSYLPAFAGVELWRISIGDHRQNWRMIEWTKELVKIFSSKLTNFFHGCGSIGDSPEVGDSDDDDDEPDRDTV